MVSQQKFATNSFFEKVVAWFWESKNTIIFVVSFLVAWELAVTVFKIPRYILPSLSNVVRQLIKNWELIWQYTLVTGMEAFIGFTIAVALGVPLAMLTGFSRILRQTFYPFAVALEMVPKIAFAPLFVVWFGFGFMPKMIIVFLVCFFPILLNGILGFHLTKSRDGVFQPLHRRGRLDDVLENPCAGGHA